MKIAKGSVGEGRNQLYIALEVNYITMLEFNATNKGLGNLARQIGGLINYSLKKRKNKQFQIR